MRGPGQMGNVRVSAKNLDIVRIDGEKNLLLVRGSVPGARGSLLLIRKSQLMLPCKIVVQPSMLQ